MARSTHPFAFDGFDATTDLLRGPVRPKKSPYGQREERGSSGGAESVPQFLKRVRAVVGKTPEVMVRITGAAKGRDHVKEHLAYITRNGKLEATNERGEVISGREAVKELAKEWLVGAPKENQRRAPDTRNMIFSMPPGTDPELVHRAVKTFADKTFGGERAYVLVLHTDEKHPHVHLTVKTRGYDGKNLHPRKADLQAWREGFAHELRALGVAAEATPRRARGVVQKPKNQAVFHMERDYKAGKKTRAPAAQLAKYAEAVREITGQEPAKVRPWEFKIAERQQKIRTAWIGTAQVLEKHPAPEARDLARQIRQFVAEMPPVVTERQQIQREVAERLNRTRTQDRGPGLG